MNWIRVTLTLLLGFGLPALLAGCFGTSPPAQFYTLCPQEMPVASVPMQSSTILWVGPVDIPGYLDRRQIVTRTGRNEITMDEFHRWGGPFGDEIAGFLVNDLGKRLAPVGFAVQPWRSVSAVEARESYRVQLRVTR